MNASSYAVYLGALRTHWSRLAPRERRALSLGMVCIGLALAWWVLLAPALHTLRQAPVQHAALDQRLQRMQQLQAEAQRLRADLPASTREGTDALSSALPDVQRSLQESVRTQLGAGAQLALQGERAQLTLKGVPAPALATWLAQVRQHLKVAPSAMQLTQTASQAGSSGTRWDGTLVLTMPPTGAAP